MTLISHILLHVNSALSGGMAIPQSNTPLSDIRCGRLTRRWMCCRRLCAGPSWGKGELEVPWAQAGLERKIRATFGHPRRHDDCVKDARSADQATLFWTDSSAYWRPNQGPLFWSREPDRLGWRAQSRGCQVGHQKITQQRVAKRYKIADAACQQCNGARGALYHRCYECLGLQADREARTARVRRPICQRTHCVLENLCEYRRSGTSSKDKIKWYTESPEYREKDSVDGEPVAFDWKMHPGNTTLKLLREIEERWRRIKFCLISSKIESSSCRCTTTLIGEQ